MSHPFNHIRSHHHERSRVHHIVGEHEPSRMPHIVHRKAGGRIGHHEDEAEDRQIVRKMVKGSALKHRQDKPHRSKPHFAKGGKVKHKGTNVNVIVAPQGGAHAAPMPGVLPPGMPSPAPAPAVPPRLPPSPMVGGPAAGAPLPPPGLGPRASGGRATYAKGGRIKNGPAWDGMMKSITPVQHTDNKGDGPNIGRGKPITYAKGGGILPASVTKLTPRRTPSGVAGQSGGLKRKTGGPIYSAAQGQMGPKLPGGAGGGEARQVKERLARKHYAAVR